MEFLSEEDDVDQVDPANLSVKSPRRIEDEEDLDYEKVAQPTMSSDWVVPQPSSGSDSTREKDESKGAESSNPFTSIDWEIKCGELVSIQAFETVRRRSFGKEMLQCWTHWAALDSMLERTVGEVVAARSLVAKKLEIEERYAAGLAELKLVASEAKRDFPKLSQASQVMKHEESPGIQNEPFPSEIVWAACGVQASAAAEQAEAARELRDGCLGSLCALEARSMSISRDLRQEGESALALASGAARAVEKLFDSFVACAAAVHADARSLDPSLDRSHADLWLADAQYRLAANGLQAAWRRSSARLALLFKEARLLEIDRRGTLSKAYDLTVASTAATRGGTEHWTPYKAWALRDEEQLNPELVAKQVDAAIKAKADALAADRRRAFLKRWQHQKEADDHQESTGPDAPDISDDTKQNDMTGTSDTATSNHDDTIAESQEDDPETTLEASAESTPIDSAPEDQKKDEDTSLAMPLDSPLVISSMILERRREGVALMNPSKRWRRCVLIVTADHFIHVLDCDEAAQDTDTAFDLLATHAIQAFLEAALARHAKPAPLKPVLSIDLTAVALQDEEQQNVSSTMSNRTTKPNINQLHITETVLNVGARKLLGKNQTRHAVFRTPAEHGPRALADLRRLILFASAS